LATGIAGKRAVSLVESRNYLGGISHQMIYRLINNGNLKSYKVGTRRFILVSELDRYIDEQVETEEVSPTLGY
jgi:excisionase family DNA binding protein